jgi:hypothetical protein
MNLIIIAAGLADAHATEESHNTGLPARPA